MSPRVREAAARWGGWLLAAGLALALYAHASALERADRRVAELRVPAERTGVRDRLIGTDLSRLRFAAPAGPRELTVTGQGRSLIWLVDPRECANCFADLSRWRDLARGPLRVTTVLVGVDAEEAARIRAGANLPGRVAVDPDGDRAATLGLSEDLPSLYLVLDGEGTVLMAEARRSATSCDWSFSGQVAELTGRSRGAVRRADAGP